MTDTTSTTEPDRVPRPRVRAGAIAWGTILCIAATAVLAIMLTPGARVAFVDWLSNLTPLMIVIGCVIAAGALVLLFGALGLIRGAQRRMAETRGTS